MILIITGIGAYALVGLIAAFLFLVKTKVDKWRDNDEAYLCSALAGAFWPLVGPIAFCIWACKAFDAKATLVAKRYEK